VRKEHGSKLWKIFEKDEKIFTKMLT